MLARRLQLDPYCKHTCNTKTAPEPESLRMFRGLLGCSAVLWTEARKDPSCLYWTQHHPADITTARPFVHSPSWSPSLNGPLGTIAQICAYFLKTQHLHCKPPSEAGHGRSSNGSCNVRSAEPGTAGQISHAVGKRHLSQTAVLRRLQRWESNLSLPHNQMQLPVCPKQ